MTTETASTKAAKAEIFTFGDPEPVLNGTNLMDYVFTSFNGRWYEPPVSFEGLAKTFRVSPHHSSAAFVRRNILLSTLDESSLIDVDEFSKLALDFMVFGNGFVEPIKNGFKELKALKAAPAISMRRGKEQDKFFMVKTFGDAHEFPKGKIVHIKEHDIRQEVYGLPEYLSALNSIWLNESATLFRRKYYLNGAHMGFIL